MPSNNDPSNNDIVTAARTYLGVPWRHQGRGRLRPGAEEVRGLADVVRQMIQLKVIPATRSFPFAAARFVTPKSREEVAC